MLTAIDIDNNDVLKWLCRCSNSIYDSTSLPILSQLPLKSDRILFHDTNNTVYAVADIYDSIGYVVIVCKGSQSIYDWVSNFTEFPTTSNQNSIPDFIYENAVNITHKLIEEEPQIFNNKKVICCGHSRGGGIASYLGYHIATNFNCQVSVMTFCSVPYASAQFKANYETKVKAKNFISIMDPLQALWVCRSIPGQTRILEFTYPIDSIIALFTIPLTAFVEEIHSLFDRLFHLTEFTPIINGAASFALFKQSTKQYSSFATIVAMFMMDVGIKVFKGGCHGLDYSEHVIGGGIEPLIREIYDLVMDVKFKTMNIVSLITRFVLGPLFELLKKVFVNAVELIDNLWNALKDFMRGSVSLCGNNLSALFSYKIIVKSQ